MARDEDEYLEEEFFQTSKDGRQERRRARTRDRSKFKKTDQAKKRKNGELHPHIKKSREELLRGRVLSIQSQMATVDCDGKLYECVLRGILKYEKTQKKNILAVGDIVLFEDVGAGEGAIVHVEPRKTVLSRADNLSRRKEQVIAVNVEQVLITVSVLAPPLKPFLIDRYIISARKGDMKPIILVNKIDLLDASTEMRQIEEVVLEETLEAYKAIDIPIIPISVVTGEGVDELKELMTGKVSVFSGQSGVGKSSLINAVTGMELPVGDVVAKTRKGAHTTTRSQLVTLDFGGWCVDTPGIKSFGVWELDPLEVQSYFSEIQEHAQGCRYPNCTHMHEPDCAVRTAAEAEEISPLRYESYCQLMESIQQEHKRR